MQLAALDPCLHRALVNLTEQRSLQYRHLLGLRLTLPTPSDNGLCPLVRNQNLFRFNQDSGTPLPQVPLLFRPCAALVVVESADDLGTGSAQPRSELRAAAWSRLARKIVEES